MRAGPITSPVTVNSTRVISWDESPEPATGSVLRIKVAVPAIWPACALERVIDKG